MTTTHHCPGQKKMGTNCRFTGKGGNRYCVEHQVICSLHKRKHLRCEPCNVCKPTITTGQDKNNAKQNNQGNKK